MNFSDFGDLIDDYEVDEGELEIYRTSYLESVLENINMIADDIKQTLDAREDEEPMEEY